MQMQMLKSVHIDVESSVITKKKSFIQLDTINGDDGTHDGYISLPLEREKGSKVYSQTHTAHSTGAIQSYMMQT